MFILIFALVGIADSGALNYTVAQSDTLYGLSRHFDIPVNWIIRANSLEDETIHPGERLQIPTKGISSLEVRPGDSLSALAVEFKVDLDYLRRYNALTGDNLQIGDKINIPAPLPEGRYRVIPGDTLLDIAIRSGLSIGELRMYNSLESDMIHPGQLLTVKAPRPEGHQVKNGESLWTIARQYSLSMDELKSWNNLEKDVIHPGQLLVLFPGLSPSNAELPREPEVVLASVPVQRIENDGPPVRGEYFFSFPKKQSQPRDDYWESPDASASVDYRRSRQVLDIFKGEIASLPKIDNSLRGWHIVIDPGHGGLDPGAIVTVADGNGNPVVITEDEYAYDVSLRLYRCLYRHGASVSLTIISPDHHIRNGTDARQTFVHRKNEVYNQAAQNGNGGYRPVGTTDGLNLRKTIAGEQIGSVPLSGKQNGTLYISIHADNTPDLPEGTAVLFDGEDDAEKERSRSFASALVPYLGNGSIIHNQPLRVLEHNPADAAVLIEVRNIHYTRNAWALRSANLREQDALRIADGVVAWANSN
ncbi:MAG: hypothetical protein DRP49_06700 [Spirochaetes bacterium]|nr:MAG: hypothetical protein DRP49_06700 [Spirochaetota bacterium]